MPPVPTLTPPPDSPSDKQAIEILRNAIRDNGVDVVISNTVNVYHGAIAAELEKVRHIWLIHEFPEQDFAYYRNKIKFISNHSDAVLSVAGALNSRLFPLFWPRKIGSFLPYVDLDERTGANQGKTAKRLVSIGLITDNKNQIELLKAYSLLADDIRSTLEVVFVGANVPDYKAVCDGFIRENGLERVSYLGFQDKPWDCVTDSDILILPSKSEAFPCVFAEAAANGIPIIASNNPGHSTAHDYFGVGTLYPLGDAEALAHAITSMGSDFKEAKSSALEARSSVRTAFSAKNAFSEIVREVESSKRPRRKRHYGSFRLNKLIVKNGS